jgi:hypothetical protein
MRNLARRASRSRLKTSVSTAQEQETKTLNQVQNLDLQADDPQYTIRTVPFEKVNEAMSLLEGGQNVGCWRTVLKWG